MLGKSIFSRVFIINLASVLVGIIILGSLQLVILSNYIARQNEDALSKNAESIVGLINNDISVESLATILKGFSKSSNTHIFVVDSRGGVLVNTRDSGYINEEPKFISTEYCKEVLAGKRNTLIGTMGGMFNETMFTLQMPVINSQANTVVGAVLVSTPIPEQQKMNQELFKMLLFSASVVLLISFLLSYMLAHRLSNPIKRIGVSAKDFAKGNFDVRVKLHENDAQVSEINELADAFNNMASELEKFEDIRMSFISNVSHELRTPMTTIGGFVDGILDDTIPPEKQKEYLTIVRSEITRLSKLVNTFLDITRMQSDQMAITKSNFDINEQIRLTIINLEKKIAHKKININLEFETEKCYVKADQDTIQMVLTNLLDNAIKFTYEDGDITVTTKTKQHDAYISVRNTGAGIPSDQQPFIFERLYKVDSSRSINKEGTGIGLYIVQNVIQAHGKKVTVDSVEGEYAEFTFQLDRGKAPAGRGENGLARP